MKPTPQQQLEAVEVYLRTLEAEAAYYDTDLRKIQVGPVQASHERRIRLDVVHDLRQRMMYPDGFVVPVFSTEAP